MRIVVRWGCRRVTVTVRVGVSVRVRTSVKPYHHTCLHEWGPGYQARAPVSV